MLDYVYENSEAVAWAVARMIPHCRERGFGKCKAIGVLENGRLIGGIVYNNYNIEASTIEITAAAITPRWLTRETIRVMYSYPFIQLKCQMVVQHTPADNERLLRQLAAGGYMFVAVPRMFGRDRDGVLCLLTYEAWCASKFNQRWLKHDVVADPSPLNEAA